MLDDAEGTLSLLLLVMMVVPPVLGIAVGMGRGPQASKASTALCIIGCIAGVLCYPAVLLGADLSATFPLGSYWGDYSISFGELQAIFCSVSSLVFLATVIHLRSSGREPFPRYPAMLCALYAACVLCMGADSMILLLICWEAVSMITFLMADNGQDDRPRWRFFAVTHIGGLLIMAVFAYLWVVTGTADMSQWSGLWEEMGTETSSILIALLFIGFGTKLGTLPFHAWMPDMYARSPTHTTVLLTTVCSNVAILVLFRGAFDFIGAEGCIPAVALILTILSAVTALWGAMLSMVQTEAKRILAYSSMENMGLVTMFLSLAMFFHSDVHVMAAVALVAALFHTLNHSVFKSLMLMSVDTVESSTGEHHMDRYGGLANVLPLLSGVALIGVLTMASIPPMNSFASEWMMLQALLGTDAIDSSIRVAMPLLVALMGLCGMVVATSYARLYGFIFLGRPRSKGAASPEKPSKTSLGAMALMAAMCVGTGVLAFPVMDAICSGAEQMIGHGIDYRAGLSGDMEPITLALMIGGSMLVIAVLARVFRKGKRESATWGCGGELDQDMQYTSEGFSQPVVRVFHPLFGDRSTLDSGRLSTRFTEPFVEYIYKPVGRAVLFVSVRVRTLQTGNIQHYLGYMLIALVAMLLAVRMVCRSQRLS